MKRLKSIKEVRAYVEDVRASADGEPRESVLLPLFCLR